MLKACFENIIKIMDTYRNEFHKYLFNCKLSSIVCLKIYQAATFVFTLRKSFNSHSYKTNGKVSSRQINSVGNKLTNFSGLINKFV